MILLIDNFDSFTYNLVHYIEGLGSSVEVYRNNKITIPEIEKMIRMGMVKKIVISPGPCNPDKAGVTLEVIEKFYKEIPILGVCLGHQAIIQAFGGKVIKGKEPVHGKIFDITHNGKGLFKGIKSPFKATRYHSLIGEIKSLPKDLKITATTKEKTGEEVIMAVEHKKYPVYGVQFHPESIASECGKELLANFLKL
jgi:anthranilate synthase/aminodeoxychorismate synthase-like glutamine amidotransferase